MHGKCMHVSNPGPHGRDPRDHDLGNPIGPAKGTGVLTDVVGRLIDLAMPTAAVISPGMGSSILPTTLALADPTRFRTLHEPVLPRGLDGALRVARRERADEFPPVEGPRRALI